jgi:hypothetical protein
MTYMITSENPLNRVVSPRLPNAPTQYEQRYIDALTNILRLYFNQVDGILGQLQSDSEFFTVYTVATLPSAVTSGAGTRAFVSDALLPVFGSTVVAGGAVKVPVYSDGTNWKVG